MIKIRLIENGTKLNEFEFDDRAEAWEFAKSLVLKSPSFSEWNFVPGKNRWVHGKKVVQIEDVAQTGPEKMARINTKIALVSELLSRTEARIRKHQNKLIQLNSDMTALQEEKSNA